MIKIIILIPVYNDWTSVSRLVNEINSIIKNLNFQFNIIIINDCSRETKALYTPNVENINSLKIINMKHNIGHARCIASGLKYIYENEDFDFVIPMDGDGEDRPEEIKIFVENINYNQGKTIVGERVKRSENFVFKTFYSIHKLLNLFFTGKSIKFGNYTCLTRNTVEKMTLEKATWSSFSGSLKKIESELVTTPSIRGKRYAGPSQMSFLNLVKHSLSIIGVFRINVLIRSVLFLFIYFFLIYKNVSFVTLIPCYFIILLNFSIFYVSKRENIKEYNDSLKNIENIDTIL